MNVLRFGQRVYHLWERIVREVKNYPKRRHIFGAKVANAAFWNGLNPTGKSPRYIAVISEFVDEFLAELVEQYNLNPPLMQIFDKNPLITAGKVPIWCCWWQGEESMPELVRLCQIRLKQLVDQDKAELHLITLDNFQLYVDFPPHILKKFEDGVITMTTMSDILRFQLLERYGGYWLDATVFFTGEIPQQYFSGDFYCQRMTSNIEAAKHEACGCNWCGFSMAGPRGSIVFQFMKEAFAEWWAHYDTIIDYVLIDYLLLTGFRHVPKIRSIIDEVPDNNEDIFAMYVKLNQPFTEELYKELTKRNVMHKLTYKMNLQRYTSDGQLTLYGYLWKIVEQ